MMRAITVVVFLWSSTSQAQSAGERADALFRQGRELLAAGKIAEACSAFEQSQKVEPAVTTLLRLAGCREKLGQIATAWRLFLDAMRLTEAASDAGSQQLHDTAKAHAQRLDPRVSRLTINVSLQSQIEGLEITRGADRIGPELWNHELPIDGGNYTITGRAPGHADWQTTARVPAEGGKLRVEVPKLESLGEKPRGQLTATRKVATGVAGASVIGGVVGAVLGGSAKGLQDKAFALCPDPAGTPGGARGRQPRGRPRGQASGRGPATLPSRARRVIGILGATCQDISSMVPSLRAARYVGRS